MTLVLAGPLMGLPPTVAGAEETGVPQEGVMPRAMYIDVVDTYLNYRCLGGASSHNIARYNETYKPIVVYNSYAISGSAVVEEWYARVCSCPAGGIVKRYQMYYHVW